MSNLAHSADAEKASVVPFGDYVAQKKGAASPRPSSRPNPFRQLWDRGYRGLLPVVPPTGGIRSAGKRPGVLGPSGWSGRSAASFNATVEDLDVWHGWGASVGVRCWNGIGGIDIDTTNPILAGRARELAINILGPAPVRYGREPKGLLPYLMPLDIGYRQARFDDGVDPKKPGLVELLAGETKMFVAQGIHPGTGKPYTWPEGIWDYSALTRVTHEQLDAYFAALASEMPGWRSLTSSVDRAMIDQQTLRGDPDRIRRAMSALPNDGRFGYPEWVNMAIALHGALPDDEALALELFEDWTDKAGIPDPTEDAARVFRSVQGPFSLGASMIEDYATKHSSGAFTVADRYFDAAAVERAARSAPVEAAATSRHPPFDFAAAARLDRARMEAIPERAFVLGSRFQAGTLTLGAGPAGVSKSTFAIKSALAIATGKPLTGETVAKSGPVLIYNSEDPRDEMLRRLMATARLDGLDIDLVQERVRILSGYDDRRLVFAERRDKGGPIRPGQDTDDLARFVAAEGIVHVALDPLVALHRGLDENAAADMEALGDQLRQFASRTGVSVDLIHHTAKARGAQADANAGQADAARGSGAVMGFVRSAYTLMPMGANFARDLGLDAGRAAQMVRLDDSKRNYARRSARELWFEILSVLPTGEVVSPGDFDSHDEEVRRRASTSAGVHVLFDIRRQRALAAIANSESEDVQQSARLQYLVALMDGDAVPRATLAASYGFAMKLGGTQARTHIDGMVPVGAMKAVEVETEGYAWSVWREERRGGKGKQWVILRKRLGQVVRSEEPSGASDEANGGVFD
ncbi:AAA family ATPase [Aureimonas phyllosphaerae]|uniref:AAA family ATPase n=1 Tax=Aureimonas phyllosphaerae TaxID=1166078 RepID=UPI003A5C00CC